MFYDNFMHLCDIHNVKPYALVKKLGAKSNSVVAQWKNGSVPRDPLLSNIANYFEVSVQELLFGDLCSNKKSPLAEARELSNEERELIELVKSLSEEEVKELSRFVDYIISKRE